MKHRVIGEHVGDPQKLLIRSFNGDWP